MDFKVAVFTGNVFIKNNYCTQIFIMLQLTNADRLLYKKATS